MSPKTRSSQTFETSGPAVPVHADHLLPEKIWYGNPELLRRRGQRAERRLFHVSVCREWRLYPTLLSVVAGLEKLPLRNADGRAKVRNEIEENRKKIDRHENFGGGARATSFCNTGEPNLRMEILTISYSNESNSSVKQM